MGGDMSMARDIRFPTKVQMGGNLGLMFELPIIVPLSLGSSLAVHNTLASSLQGGILYRGFSGTDLRLFASVKGLIYIGPGRFDLYIGASGGGSARYDRYDYTMLYFFYPGIFLEPFLEMHITKRGMHSFQLSLPLDLFFRKDLAMHGSFGIGIMWKIYPLIRRSRKRKE